MIEPLRLNFDVACDPERAFAVWTQRAATWWPKMHTVSREAGLQIVFEPRVGGRIFERTSSGREEDWGEILVWEPPVRLGYLWHLRADRTDATEVQITFTGQAQGGTRVDIEHRGWERLGARADARRRANRRGWEGLLPAYVAACASDDLAAGAPRVPEKPHDPKGVRP